MIATTISEVSYAGNESTSTPYPVTFPLSADSALVAIETDGDGAETTLAPSDFAFTPTVDINGRITGGSVTTDPAIPATSTLSIRRVTPRTQTLQLEDGQRLSAESLESALDRLVMIAQEQDREIAAIGS